MCAVSGACLIVFPMEFLARLWNIIPKGFWKAMDACNRTRLDIQETVGKQVSNEPAI